MVSEITAMKNGAEGTGYFAIASGFWASERSVRWDGSNVSQVVIEEKSPPSNTEGGAPRCGSGCDARSDYILRGGAVRMPLR